VFAENRLIRPIVRVICVCLCVGGSGSHVAGNKTISCAFL